MKRAIVSIYILIFLTTTGFVGSAPERMPFLGYAGAYAGDHIDQSVAEAKKAGVPDSVLDVIVNRARAKGLSEDSLESLIKVAADAGRQRLYLGPILDKIQEGLAKNVPPEVIERVSRRVMARVAEAEESLESFLPSLPHKNMVLDAALEARERGVSAAGVRGLFSAASSRKDSSHDPGRIIEVLDGTAGLVNIGIEEDNASGLMKEAVSHGYTKDELRELSVEFTRNLGFLERRERTEVLSSTLDMLKEGRGVQRIKESLRAHTAIPHRTLGSGKGLSPSERGKEGIGPDESEGEHDIPRPAPREKDRPDRQK